ncbi:MAG TPA: DASH family cryptochrome [Flavilitoribacter sp.]|nr:DASH family cryptochrome [Flavilitoribacter sp.]HMQ86522.1 DASH family cryptochrome [Flavilitoribacter sp.]
MDYRRAIVWFRQDLRLHDNEALLDALKSADEVIPVYVFDPRIFKGKTKYGFPKTGSFRAKFILESVIDLRASLQAIGSDLWVRIGKPEEVIFELARSVKSSWVFCNRERTQEEVLVQDALEKNLWTIGQEIWYSRGKMLLYTADLPFPVPHTPDVFTQFRKEVEKIVPVRDPLPAPDRLPPLSTRLDYGPMPDLRDLGHATPPEPAGASNQFKGGEKAALERLRYYIHDSLLVDRYKETRNQLLGMDYSSKFSPWLSQGCLSPKLIYSEIKRHEQAHGENESTYWLVFELLWRDFFRFMAKKHGNKIFREEGITGKKDHNWTEDWDLFSKWAEGQTGIPFIDANMRELRQTGFMSNRGRQNAASFLVKDLNINWLMGAEYFESLLVDYDPCSNYGNWNYIAGVGSDPREDRYFNIHSQSKRYDPKGDYIRFWVPELRNLPQEKIHQPEYMSLEEQAFYQVRIGKDYPEPMIDLVN